MLRKVLLATDGSPGAHAAARWLADLADQMPGLTVTLVHVIPSYGGVSAPGANPGPQAMADMAAPALAAARRALGELVPTDTRVVLGPVAEELATLAKREGYDLIVLGRRGLNPLEELLIGSVSQRVILLAPCPVAIVPRP